MQKGKKRATAHTHIHETHAQKLYCSQFQCKLPTRRLLPTVEIYYSQDRSGKFTIAFNYMVISLISVLTSLFESLLISHC